MKIKTLVTMFAVTVSVVMFSLMAYAGESIPGNQPPNVIPVIGPIERPPPVRRCPSSGEPTEFSKLGIASEIRQMSDSSTNGTICMLANGIIMHDVTWPNYGEIYLHYLEDLQEIRGYFISIQIPPTATFMWQVSDANSGGNFKSPVHAVALSPVGPGDNKYQFRISPEQLAAIYSQIPYNSAGFRGIVILGEVCGMSGNSLVSDQKWILGIISPMDLLVENHFLDEYLIGDSNYLDVVCGPSHKESYWPGFDFNPVR